jgi:hypothetical protein
LGRLGQLFIAPGPEDEPLPIPESPWHAGRTVWLPMEHWQVIVQHAEQLDAERAALLRRYAYPPERRLLLPPQELDAALHFIGELAGSILAAAPLVPEVSEEFPEDYTNVEHARMLEAVAAVLREARRRGEPFEADADT